jgi:hypothetical protein
MKFSYVDSMLCLNSADVSRTRQFLQLVVSAARQSEPIADNCTTLAGAPRAERSINLVDTVSGLDGREFMPLQNNLLQRRNVEFARASFASRLDDSVE